MTDSGGATAIEYALIGTIVSIIIVTSVTTMGTKLLAFFNTVATGLR